MDMTLSQQRKSSLARRLHLGSQVYVLLLLLVVIGAHVTGHGFWVGLAGRTAILAIAALALSFITGQGGLVSFGHAASFGIGAYAVLIAGSLRVTDLFVVLPLAFFASCIFAIATGAVALRTRGVYFIMITLAFAQMAYFIFASLSAFGGDDGTSLAAPASVFGSRFPRGDLPLALLAVGILAVALFFLERVTASRFGLVLRGAKENESRLLALGFQVYRYRLIAYALAGGIAGIAGALLALQTEYVSPAYMNWHRSGEFIMMIVLGGIARLPGAILGAIVLVVVEESLGHFTEYWRLGLGLLIVGAVLARGADLISLIRGTRHG